MATIDRRRAAGALHGERSASGGAPLGGRLGLNVPKGWWPTAPMLKAYEAAGFGHVQVHAPPIAMLRDGEAAGRHAAAVRRALEPTGLRLVLHGPDELMAGDAGHDHALAALIAYAQVVEATHVVYHGGQIPASACGPLAGQDRARQEERSLRRLLPDLEQAGFVLCIENLAPVHPGPPRLCHDPAWVAGLVRRLDSQSVAMCFDLGHAHITRGRRDLGVEALLAESLDVVALVHAHDNLGPRRSGEQAPGVDPLRLDLHLPPGAGTLPWDAVAPLLDHLPHAPLQLEVHPPHRPEPVALAEVTATLLSQAVHTRFTER
jgi:sugar phosphate isomerase/epimerase